MSSSANPLDRRRLLLAGGALLVTGCTPGGQADLEIAGQASATPGGDPVDAFALTGATLPGQDEPLTITVRGRRIASLGTTDVAPPGEIGVVDVDGATVIPGFIDSHVHMQFAPDPGAIVLGGVTTVRDLGGPPTAAQALRDGGVGDLRVLLAGRILTATAGYPSRSWGADGTAREISDPDDAALAVAEQVEAGATVIKLALEPAGGGPILDRESLEVIVAEARAAGRGVTAHVGSAEMLALALDLGVDELAHLPLHAVTATEMEEVAAAGVRLVPTLAIRGNDPGAIEATTAFLAAGGTVLYGTDLGNGGTSPGIMVAEVAAMQSAGMSPAEVLAAATTVPADLFGLDVGRIEEARVADLVVLDGDPFDDPSAYDRVRLVVVGGQLLAP